MDTLGTLNSVCLMQGVQSAQVLIFCAIIVNYQKIKSSFNTMQLTVGSKTANETMCSQSMHQSGIIYLALKCCHLTMTTF